METQIGNGNIADCEIVRLDGLGETYKVKLVMVGSDSL